MKTISKRGIELIQYFEVSGAKNLSRYLKAYICPAGIPTIGFGHTKTITFDDVMSGKTISVEEAYKLLHADIAPAASIVNRKVLTNIVQHQFDALVSFSFNVGITAFANSTLLRKLNMRDKMGASFEFQRWNKSNGKILNGLTARRKAERLLFDTGVLKFI